MKLLRAIDIRWVLLVFVCAGLMTLTGCATSGADAENLSERPWNSPKSWENGVPGGMMQGR